MIPMAGQFVQFLKRFPSALLLARYAKRTLLDMSVRQKKSGYAYDLQVEGVRLRYHPEMRPFPSACSRPCPCSPFTSWSCRAT